MKSFFKHRHAIWQRTTLISFLLSFFLFGFPSVTASANTLGEEFLASDNFAEGSVVSLNKDNPKEVELSNLTNDEYLIGVVNGSKDNSVTYSKSLSNVTVALTGEVYVFITDAGGDISRGDFVGASWIEGVAMKSELKNVQRLLGVALDDANFDSGAEYGDISTSEGTKNSRVGTVRIRLFNKDSLTSLAEDDSALESLLRNISGKKVSLGKSIVVSLIFIASILISGFFVGSSIKGSFISLGRNPRASTAIFRDLSHVTTVSLIVILLGTALSYVVLVL